MTDGAEDPVAARNEEDPRSDDDGRNSDERLDFAEVKADARLASTAASERARYLALAGIGIIWVYSGGTGDQVAEVDLGDFRFALYIFVVTLGLDFAQYVWRGLRLRWFLRSKEDELKTTGVNYPTSIRNVADVIWVLKLLAAALGWLLLLGQVSTTV